MKNFIHLAGMALNQPLLLEPSYAQTFFAGLADRLNIAELKNQSGEILKTSDLEALTSHYSANPHRERTYQIIDGVAVLPVDGTLVHKFGYLQPTSGMTGYDGILHRAQQAAADPDVQGILLDQDSPGGSVAGCFDTVSALQALEAQSGKPIWSLCHDMTCSASMALACGASRRLITNNGRAGSVGVIMAHTSYEKHLADKGICVTLIAAGKSKADGNPYENLPEDVLQNFQAETEQLRTEFASIVAASINQTPKDVLATEAKIYRGQAAVNIGFADEVVNGHEAIDYFAEHLKTHSSHKSTISMTKSQTTASNENVTTTVPTQQNEPEAVDTQAIAEQAKSEERARIQSIMQHDEAQGRQSLAAHFAYHTNMKTDEAVAALVQSTKDTASNPSLDSLMNAETQPNIGAGDAENSANPEEDLVALAIASYNQATGAKLGQ